MKILRIIEKYTADNTYLKKYLQKGGVDIDPYMVWGSESIVDPSVLDWLADKHPDVIKQLMQQVGVDEPEDLELETDPSMVHELDPRLQQEYTDWVEDDYVEWYQKHDPAMAPSTSFYDTPTLLKRETWLVHFSDDAYGIANKGFKYGVDQMDQLGLTTHLGDQAKKYGGYNFAFEAGSRYANNAASESKYGGEAVMFTNSGVKAYHWGDEEDQVMFWGADVDPRGIIYIAKEYDNWCVQSHPNSRRSTDKECLHSSEDFNEVTDWIEKNWRQYSKIITGW